MNWIRLFFSIVIFCLGCSVFMTADGLIQVKGEILMCTGLILINMFCNNTGWSKP